MATETKHGRPCAKCGQPVAKRDSKRFCSNACRRVDPISLFWKRVVTGDNCWSWIGSRTDRGYGQIEVSWRTPGRILIHRLSWEIHNGPIPDGVFVCHKCDNPICSNPQHLFLGTNKDNINDRIAKKRDKRGEASSNAQITANVACRIVRLYREGKTMREIQRGLNVGRGCVFSVVHGITWSHATGVGRWFRRDQETGKLHCIGIESRIGVSVERAQ